MPRLLFVFNTFFVYTVSIRPTGWSLSSRGSTFTRRISGWESMLSVVMGPTTHRFELVPLGFWSAPEPGTSKFLYLRSLRKYGLSSSSILPPLLLCSIFFVVSDLLPPH